MKVILNENQIKNLLENINIKKQYLGQCDQLRFQNPENEDKWQDMMRLKKKISFTRFLNSVDMSEMLDDDVTPKDYIKDCIREDDETGSYISKWGEDTCMFLQTSGFEFIFK